MAIFNSLGSNYTGKFVLASLFGRQNPKDAQNLTRHLKELFGGEVTLTYKGRQALELALRRSGLESGSKVGINGFTCYVVYEAVVKAGLKPVFVDIEPGTLNFNTKQLSKYTDLKAVIVQNTLGFPSDMASIQEYAKKNNLMIVEDLAHSFGAVYENGKEAGKVGDLVMLSFSQDKQNDVVAGGALIDRRAKSQPQVLPGQVSGWQQLKNRCYPFWAGLIRLTYPIGLGRLLHFGLKKLKVLATPMSDDLVGLHQMSPLAIHLLDSRLKDFSDELVHRRQVANVYQKNLPAEMQFNSEGEPTYLRFPIIVKNRAELIAELKNHQVFVGDTWYDGVIAPNKYLKKTDYQLGECPNGEKLTESIMNLPTHLHVSETGAKAICDIINEWLKSGGK